MASEFTLLIRLLLVTRFNFFAFYKLPHVYGGVEHIQNWKFEPGLQFECSTGDFIDNLISLFIDHQSDAAKSGTEINIEYSEILKIYQEAKNSIATFSFFVFVLLYLYTSHFFLLFNHQLISLEVICRQMITKHKNKNFILNSLVCLLICLDFGLL